MKTTTNKVELTGYAGMNAEIFKFDNGNALMKFKLATHENFKRSTGEWVNQTYWHNIIMWGKDAITAQPMVQKGSKVQLEGKLIPRTYVDKENNTRYIYEVQASKIVLLKEEKTEETLEGAIAE
ncbi:MAG: single-stranded DNA-binding protein [Bacteroidales bacterium]|nr:single-stranded DNA-binding protein [Bacteroidales bacterium]MDY0216100.1 single-stranded DNA-binding protein [Bacteroidales bacterium]